MEILLIANIIGLTLALAFSTFSFFGWYKAEKKLAKHGESTFFKPKK